MREALGALYRSVRLMFPPSDQTMRLRANGTWGQVKPDIAAMVQQCSSSLSGVLDTFGPDLRAESTSIQERLEDRFLQLRDDIFSGAIQNRELCVNWQSQLANVQRTLAAFVGRVEQDLQIQRLQTRAVYASLEKRMSEIQEGIRGLGQRSKPRVPSPGPVSRAPRKRCASTRLIHAAGRSPAIRMTPGSRRAKSRRRTDPEESEDELEDPCEPSASPQVQTATEAGTARPLLFQSPKFGVNVADKAITAEAIAYGAQGKLGPMTSAQEQQQLWDQAKERVPKMAGGDVLFQGSFMDSPSGRQAGRSLGNLATQAELDSVHIEDTLVYVQGERPASPEVFLPNEVFIQVNKSRTTPEEDGEMLQYAMDGGVDTLRQTLDMDPNLLDLLSQQAVTGSAVPEDLSSIERVSSSPEDSRLGKAGQQKDGEPGFASAEQQQSGPQYRTGPKESGCRPRGSGYGILQPPPTISVLTNDPYGNPNVYYDGHKRYDETLEVMEFRDHLPGQGRYTYLEGGSNFIGPMTYARRDDDWRKWDQAEDKRDDWRKPPDKLDQGPPTGTTPKRPLCREHGAPMKYVSSRAFKDLWTCAVEPYATVKARVGVGALTSSDADFCCLFYKTNTARRQFNNTSAFNVSKRPAGLWHTVEGEDCWTHAVRPCTQGTD